MNSFSRHLVLLSLSSVLGMGVVHAGGSATPSPQQLASASYPQRSINAADTGALRRANPNSRQGTESISPNLRGPNVGPSQVRPPTLENGGIGNGYPTRQPSPRPATGTDRRSN